MSNFSWKVFERAARRKTQGFSELVATEKLMILEVAEREWKRNEEAEDQKKKKKALK